MKNQSAHLHGIWIYLESLLLANWMRFSGKHNILMRTWKNILILMWFIEYKTIANGSLTTSHLCRRCPTKGILFFRSRVATDQYRIRFLWFTIDNFCYQSGDRSHIGMRWEPSQWRRGDGNETQSPKTQSSCGNFSHPAVLQYFGSFRRNLHIAWFNVL